MKELFSKRAKKIITTVSLSCFLCSPVSYVCSMNQALAGALNTNVAYEQQFNTVGFDKDDHWNRGRSDEDKDWKKPPRHDDDDDWTPPPPRHDDDDDDDWTPPPPRHDDDDDDWDRDRPPRHDDDDDDWDRDRPPRHDRDDRDDRDDDSDKDYDKGDITAAVLIGGVIGAIIAKNT
ncbi:hypothetical protein SAMN05216340_10453 [Megamonas sp. Calf98-2]|uniref:hypothetical protein n=1 Tax=Megamonas sp. Calf98-2 TaxID=1855330 RepID=UPI0008ACA510|nr:hypothetical protein [Megamonas sp. Calf98-2]SEN09417.1 hypothetical protein SAMN05216340_10453 [Megamonas sp. Calf98-2]